MTEIWRSFNLPERDLREQAEQITAPNVLIWGDTTPSCRSAPPRPPGT